MKILTYILIGYLAYRFFIKPMLIAEPNKKKVNSNNNKTTSNNNGGEYIDYEEVDDDVV